ncbi:NUDIX hydrolase [Antarctobacter sp.]|uniref:NUDIX hydrolase n=1 Tax=Antarctobacter sp. TaxID=1872577 RepID=UPI002B264E23|nr:NUDIX hydrolase [Antarctobacter sp.]
MTPRFGAPPQAERRYSLRRGAYAILPRDGRLLLTHQAAPNPEVQLPGGGIDPGENALQALHREVFEETGWRIARPRRLGAFRRFTFMPEYDLWAEKLCIIYIAVPVRPHGPPTEAGHAPLWRTPREAMCELGNPGDRAFVERHCTLW